MKLKKLAVLAMACIMAMTAMSLTGCSQNQGSTGTDETQNASSEAGDLQSGSGNGDTTTAEENTKDEIGDVKDVLADEPVEVTYFLMEYVPGERGGDTTSTEYTTTFSGIDLNKVNEIALEKANEEKAQGIMIHKSVAEYLEGYLEQAGYERFFIEYEDVNEEKVTLYPNKHYLDPANRGPLDSEPDFTFILDLALEDVYLYSAEIHDGHPSVTTVCPYIYVDDSDVDVVLPTVEELEEIVDFLYEYNHPEGVNNFRD